MSGFRRNWIHKTDGAALLKQGKVKWLMVNDRVL